MLGADAYQTHDILPCLGILKWHPYGGDCHCGNPGTDAPCWNCENSTLVCDLCGAAIQEYVEDVQTIVQVLGIKGLK